MIGFDFIWLISGPVFYSLLATESDDSVAESVESFFYYFLNEISF